MFIEELYVRSFGALSEKKITLKDGFNVIYGPNESGKSTLLAFVVFVFYGTKIKKVNKDISFKEKYMPWNNNSACGQITFVSDGLRYVLYRELLSGKSNVSLYCQSTGEQITDVRVLTSPGMYFFGVNSESFYKTVFLTASGAKISSDGDDEIITRLRNLFENGADDISYKTIRKHIDEEILSLSSPKRKNAVIPTLEGELFDLENELKKETEASDAKLRDEKKIDECRRKIAFLEKELKKYYMLKDAENSKTHPGFNKVFYFLLVGILCIASTLALGFLLPVTQSAANFVVAVLVVLLSAIFIVYTVNYRNQKEIKLFTLKGFDDKIKEIQNALSDTKVTLAVLEERISREDFTDKEYYYQRIAFIKDELVKYRNRCAALKLASDCIDKAYTDMKTLFSPELSQKAGELLDILTCGNYSGVFVNDSFDISVLTPKGYVSAQFLSRGALEQIYLSLRLSLAELILNRDPVPVFLDDALALYDVNRRNNALNFLVEYSGERQILFATCREDEYEYLSNYNQVNFIYF